MAPPSARDRQHHFGGVPRIGVAKSSSHHGDRPPQLLLLLMLPLLGKPSGGVRPAGLFPILMRGHARIRRKNTAQLEKEQNYPLKALPMTSGAIALIRLSPIRHWQSRQLCEASRAALRFWISQKHVSLRLLSVLINAYWSPQIIVWYGVCSHFLEGISRVVIARFAGNCASQAEVRRPLPHPLSLVWRFALQLCR